MFPTYNEAFNSFNIPYNELNTLKAKGKKERLKRLVIFAVVKLISLILMVIGERILLYIGIGAIILAAFYAFFIPVKGEVEYKKMFKRTVIGPLAHNIITMAKIADGGSRYEQRITYEPKKKLHRSWLDKVNY